MLGAFHVDFQEIDYADVAILAITVTSAQFGVKRKNLMELMPWEVAGEFRVIGEIEHLLRALNIGETKAVQRHTGAMTGFTDAVLKPLECGLSHFKSINVTLRPGCERSHEPIPFICANVECNFEIRWAKALNQ